MRTRASASGYLNKTLTTPTNNLKWTWSGWVKRGTLSASNVPFGAGDGSSDNFGSVQFTTGDTIQFSQISGGAYNVQVITSAVFRDPAAWYHIVIIYDSANATSTDRVQIYVNSVRQSVTYSTGPFAQNTASKINSAIAHYISKLDYTTVYFDGYQAEVNFVDGQALTPSSFGKTDNGTGQWVPKKFAGTYGTNGFYLKFADTSAATAAAIGKDSSGNGNNWTPSGISVTAGVTYDAMIDSPTLSAVASNYAVMNPLNTYSSITVNDANLKVALSEAAYRKSVATMAFPTTGKYYVEANLTGIDYASYGIVTPEAPLSDRVGATATGYGATTGTAQWDKNNNGTSSGNFWSFTAPANPVLQIAVDTTSGKLWLGYNNIWLDGSGGVTGNPSAGTNETFTINTTRIYLPSFGGYKSDSIVFNVNFGQRPFAYTPPSGYVALNSFNLA